MDREERKIQRRCELPVQDATELNERVDLGRAGVSDAPQGSAITEDGNSYCIRGPGSLYATRTLVEFHERDPTGGDALKQTSLRDGCQLLRSKHIPETSPRVLVTVENGERTHHGIRARSLQSKENDGKYRDEGAETWPDRTRRRYPSQGTETGEEQLSAPSESEQNGVHDNTPAKEELRRLRTQLLTLQATVKPRRRIPGLDFAESWALEDFSAKYVPYVPEFQVQFSASIGMETASPVQSEDPGAFKSVINSSGDGEGGSFQVVPSPTPDAMPPLPTSPIIHRVVQLAAKTTGTTRKEERPGGTASPSTPIALVVASADSQLTNGPRPPPDLSLSIGQKPINTWPRRLTRIPPRKEPPPRPTDAPATARYRPDSSMIKYLTIQY
ncbi:hypothetical protein HETIRDRAFT_108115, partial [Heterobasidion irregulare TC 32-1]